MRKFWPHAPRCAGRPEPISTAFMNRLESAAHHPNYVRLGAVRGTRYVLRRLSAQLLKVQDEERRRIAREFHHNLAQYLAAIKIDLGLASVTRANYKARLSEVQQLIDRAIAETRTPFHLLHPPSLDLAGFASSLCLVPGGLRKT